MELISELEKKTDKTDSREEQTAKEETGVQELRSVWEKKFRVEKRKRREEEHPMARKKTLVHPLSMTDEDEKLVLKSAKVWEEFDFISDTIPGRKKGTKSGFDGLGKNNGTKLTKWGFGGLGKERQSSEDARPKPSPIMWSEESQLR